jgi:hypothetical protein
MAHLPTLRVRLADLCSDVSRADSRFYELCQSDGACCHSRLRGGTPSSRLSLLQEGKDIAIPPQLFVKKESP